VQFARTAAPYINFVKALTGVMKWASWSKLTTISAAEQLFSRSDSLLGSELKAAKITVDLSIRFDPRKFDRSELSRVASSLVRVVVVQARPADVLDVALAARENGMIAVGYAWLGFESTEPFESVEGSPELQTTTKLSDALQGWLFLSQMSSVSQSFLDRVRAARTPIVGDPFVDDVDLHAAYLYDSIMLYARAAGQMLRAKQSLSNGPAVVEEMKSVSFQGMTGLVQIDSRGDRLQSVQTENVVLNAAGALERTRVGVFDASSQKYMTEAGRTVVWPGGATTIPVDTVPVEAAFNTIWILVGCIIGAAIIVGLVILLLKRFSERFKHFFGTLVTFTPLTAMLFFRRFAALRAVHQVFEAAKQISSTLSEAADFVTDAVSFQRAVVSNSLDGGYQLSTTYKVAYSCVFATSVVSSVVSFIYRMIQGRKLVKAVISGAKDDDERINDPKVREVLDHVVTEMRQKSMTVYDLVNQFDTSKDGVLSMDEVRRGLSGMGLQLTSAELDSVVMVFDKDHSGEISSVELGRVLTEYIKTNCGKDERKGSLVGTSNDTSKNAMLVKLRWEAEKSKRDLISHLITLGTAALEDVRHCARRPSWHSFDHWPFQIPFTVLNGVLVFDQGVVDKWVSGR
jgi:hypothetical protein